MRVHAEEDCASRDRGRIVATKPQLAVGSGLYIARWWLWSWIGRHDHGGGVARHESRAQSEIVAETLDPVAHFRVGASHEIPDARGRKDGEGSVGVGIAKGLATDDVRLTDARDQPQIDGASTP